MEPTVRESEPRVGEAARFCREILPGVSRTFSLSIRVLPGLLGEAVRCAYLVCRIADTVEDEPTLPATAKAELLDDLARCFDGAEATERFVARASEIGGQAAHVRLTRNADLVFECYRSLPAATQLHVRHWATEMITGMRKFVLRYPHGIRIQTLDEYREYCYYVAGTVGYLLTDLWHEHSPSIGAAKYNVLRERCRAFAEALQTVNILKDVARDAEYENSIYVPEQLLEQYGSSHATILDSGLARQNRSAMTALVQLAWSDLEQARAYLLLIPRRAVSIRLFCVLPLLFAYATLRDLTRTPSALVRREVVKISRAEVKWLTILSFVSVLSNRALARLTERARTRPLILGRRATAPA